MVGTPEAADSATAKGLGDQPMSLGFILDDDSEVEIAVAADDLGLATGPYRVS